MRDPKKTRTKGGELSPPRFVREPASRLVVEGGRVSLRAAAAGNPLPSYQWFRDGEKIEGATSERLTLSRLERGQAGRYHCEARNLMGAATSRPAVLTFLDEVPEVRIAPVDAAIPEGRAFAFRLVSPDHETLKGLSVQWACNGKRIRGAVGPELSFLRVKPKYEGEYKALVFVGDDIYGSNTARLRALPAEAREQVKQAAGEDAKTESFFYDPARDDESERLFTDVIEEATGEAPAYPAEDDLLWAVNPPEPETEAVAEAGNPGEPEIPAELEGLFAGTEEPAVTAVEEADSALDSKPVSLALRRKKALLERMLAGVQGRRISKAA